MNVHARKLLSVSLALALIAGCDGSPSPGPASSGGGTPAMPNMQQAASKPEHMAEGTLNSVDPASGTVNITHGPVASANWPGMTMSFKLANPAAASDLKPGQRVEFHFKIESGMDATVTQIKPIE